MPRAAVPAGLSESLGGMPDRRKQRASGAPNMKRPASAKPGGLKWRRPSKLPVAVQ